VRGARPLHIFKETSWPSKGPIYYKLELQQYEHWTLDEIIKSKRTFSLSSPASSNAEKASADNTSAHCKITYQIISPTWNMVRKLSKSAQQYNLIMSRKNDPSTDNQLVLPTSVPHNISIQFSIEKKVHLMNKREKNSLQSYSIIVYSQPKWL